MSFHLLLIFLFFSFRLSFIVFIFIHFLSFLIVFSRKKKRFFYSVFYYQLKIQLQLSKLLCTSCDKLKFRCICQKPLSQSTSKSTIDLNQTNAQPTNGSPLLPIRWSNVFGNRNSNNNSSNDANDQTSVISSPTTSTQGSTNKKKNTFFPFIICLHIIIISVA